MTAPRRLPLGKLPAVWATYPRVVLNKRPPIESVIDAPEFAATVSRVTLSARSIARYAAMCGFDPARGVPVTFPHVLAMPLHLKIFAQRDFPLRPMGLIHLSNWIEMPGRLESGMDVAIEVAARNYQRTDTGITFDIATEISAGGQALWRENCGFLSRWTEPVERSGARPPRPPRAPKDSAVLAELDVTRSTAWAYARASADYNPIHLSNRAARFFGLRGAIGHGMWSLARSLAQAPAPDGRDAGRIDTQFLSPVQLPGRVTIKEWREDEVWRRALCDVRTGRVHMYAWWSARGA